MTNLLLLSADPIALGKRLAAVRSALALTQQQASEAIGATSSEIADIEDGVRLPRATELVKLAQFYGVPVIECFGYGHQLFSRDGSELTQKSLEAAVLAFWAGELTEAELARWLGIDIVSMREFVQQADTGSSWDLARLEQLRTERQDRVKTLSAFASSFADLSAEEIERETARAVADVRAEQRALKEKEGR